MVLSILPSITSYLNILSYESFYFLQSFFSNLFLSSHITATKEPIFCLEDPQFITFYQPVVISRMSVKVPIVAAFESTVHHQVSDLLLNPPENDLYDALKRKLLEVIAESYKSKIKKLLSEVEVGNQKPS